jgi:P27 family predicted phage terminase small subunit
MGARGPKSIPTALKRLNGNPGKRPLPKPGTEPEPKLLTEIPDPPPWLGEYGTAEWHRVAAVLVEQRLLSVADMLTFTAYCANVDLLVRSNIDIEKNGLTVRGARGEVRNPALAAFAQATTSLRALASEFGMTPSSRSRMQLPDDEGESLAGLMGDSANEDAI